MRYAKMLRRVKRCFDEMSHMSRYEMPYTYFAELFHEARSWLFHARRRRAAYAMLLPAGAAMRSARAASRHAIVFAALLYVPVFFFSVFAFLAFFAAIIYYSCYDSAFAPKTYMSERYIFFLCLPLYKSMTYDERAARYARAIQRAGARESVFRARAFDEKTYIIEIHIEMIIEIVS